MPLLRNLCCALLLLNLAGCYSLSPIDIDKSIRPADGGSTSYLVGVVGVWPGTKYSLHEQSIQLRQKGGGGFASARLRNNVHMRTPRDIRDGQRGIGTLFVMPLKPGRYELYNVLFKRSNGPTVWKREDFSITLQLEPGKAYYIGDFRAACIDYNAHCSFIHSYDVERDQALTARKHPNLPPLQRLELEHLEGAYPFVLDSNAKNAAIFESIFSGQAK
ncbi:hypothetical protein DNK06_10575 [Pseudomonas daroniae]|uniref:Lipoprotein n=1 Tax=Phytopseudomonas daroniae TaxID=2487519 RepID=A0A4Q9QM39_9GAMM|nr:MULTISPECIES: hypothetical protein [Pseudomonas]TBU80337.1 hypothetical protein DNK06_10575 [Pseudomonas daroniae]TBU85545.1 hypothetical protein DNK31_03175 [Pseudomonas sp. FRB 228]TBU94393.1 hypothetical protein DNJ99_03175 [Pseudomonas daroniae]